jgi:hypothetical protein
VSWNRWIRETHRWVSIVLTVTIIANFVALAAGHGRLPPPYITYSPLPPLALLLLTGLYLFVLPYTTGRAAARSRTARQPSSQAST